jgi:hypothetical protein
MQPPSLDNCVQSTCVLRRSTAWVLIEYFLVSVPHQTLPLLSDRFSVNGQTGVGVGCELPLRWGVKLEKFAWVGLDAWRHGPNIYKDP